MKSKIAFFCAALTLAALVSGCRSAPRGIAPVTPISVELVKQTGAPDAFRLSGPFGLKSFLGGSATVSTDTEMTLTVESFHWFNNWKDGWTEARFAASGTLILEKIEQGWTISASQTPTLEYAERATIRYRDTIIEGDGGLKQFSNRHNRIAAASDFLKTVLPDKDPKKAAFRTEAGRILFPEVYGYPKGKTASENMKANRSKAEGVAWDTGYTADAFLPEFAEVRNTGTMYRDWEESEDLFYVSYAWEELFGAPGRTANIIERKK